MSDYFEVTYLIRFSDDAPARFVKESELLNVLREIERETSHSPQIS